MEGNRRIAICSSSRKDDVMSLALCVSRLYRLTIQDTEIQMIVYFRHKGLEQFFRLGSKAGIQPKHEARLRAQLTRLDAATAPQDMALPAWKLHALSGQMNGCWAVSVDKNWRLISRFAGDNVEMVDYLDYH